MAVVFPIVWRFVDIYGVAKIDRTFDDIVHNKVVRVTSRLLTFYIWRVSLCDHSVVFPSVTNTCALCTLLKPLGEIEYCLAEILAWLHVYYTLAANRNYLEEGSTMSV